MTESPFDFEGGLLVVDAWIHGPIGHAPLRLAIDTAATLTLVTPEIVERIGYSARDGERSSVSSAIGTEYGYRVRVERLSSLEQEVPDLLVNVFDLPDRAGIDGLLGLNFLSRFDIELRFSTGLICAERI